MTITTSNKVEWAGQPQLAVDGKLFYRTRTMPAIELSLLWNERVEAKVNARLSRADSKLDVDVNLIRLQRRIKVNSSHKFLSEMRSVNLNVAWDADKDASKQVGVTGNLTLSPSQRMVDMKYINEMMEFLVCMTLYSRILLLEL